MNDPSPSYVVGGRALAEAHHDEICGLYDAVFSVAPFAWSDQESAAHRTYLAEVREDPTFGIVVAMVGDDLVGFAYGHRLPVDHGWWNGFPDPLDADVTAEWDGRTFALLDLAVDVRWRDKGVGKRLINLLLESRQEERAVLSVQPTASRTQQIYRHLGWRKIGRKGPITNAVTPFWDIFVKTIR